MNNKGSVKMIKIQIKQKQEQKEETLTHAMKRSPGKRKEQTGV